MRYRERLIEPARSVPYFGGRESETMFDDPTWTPTLAWKPMSKSRVRVVTSEPMHFRYNWYDPWTGNWNGPVDVGSGDSVKDGPLGFFPVTTTPDFPSFDLQTGFIWNAIRKYGKSDVNIGVFLGELRETVKMFHRPWSLVSDISRGKFPFPRGMKNAQKVIDFVSSKYLGYRYGWRPFLQDVKGFTRLTRRLDEKYRADTQSKPRVLKSYLSKAETASFSGRNDFAYEAPHMVTWDNSATLETSRCEWCLVESNPSAQAKSLAQKFASTMHLADVASIAWELTPYSFIADWFLPIGDTIASLTDEPANLVSVSEPWQWTQMKKTVKVSTGAFSNSQYSPDISYGYTVESVSFSRSSLGALPPKPSNIDGFQKLDLALIVGQSLGGLFGKSFRR